jgi:hypothetical protein
VKAPAIALALASVAAPSGALLLASASVSARRSKNVGGDYGPEYYTAFQANRIASRRGTGRCRITLIETRSGVRRVRRCS